MTAYYNDNDPAVCDWLEELIRRDLIAPGVVDRRSILDVEPSDLKGFIQTHFFAGIGGWSYALRLAGWPDDRPVMTGSPPCQPFSVAGKQLGKDDARHLAPKFVSLVGSARPAMLFGEQVASSDVFGKAPKKSRNRVETAPEWAWLDDLLDRLEASRYAAGAVDFPSAGVGSPHIRQRTFFGAVSEEWLEHTKSDGWLERWSESSERGAVSGRSDIGLADDLCQQREECVSGCREGDGEERRWSPIELAGFCRSDGLADHNEDRFNSGTIGQFRDTEHHAEPCSSAIGMAYGIGEGLEGHGGHVDRSCEPGRIGTQPTGSTSSGGDFDGMEQSSSLGRQRGQTTSPGDFDDRSTSERSEGEHGSGVSGSHRIHQHGTGPDHGFWGTADWLFCRDGKWRPVEPGTFPLAHGLPRRMGLLRGYGNAINPIAASTFIRAFMAGALRTRSSHLRQHEIEELI